MQVDTKTGAVLQVAYRRSDFVESLHDGSSSGDWAKVAILSPSALILAVVWATGLYLFIRPYLRKEKSGITS